MSSFSIVIICKNEAGIIGATLQSLQGITDDIVVYDNGSTDGTQQIVQQFPVKLYEGNWYGFGKTKNNAIGLAKYDWILSLDADEVVGDELKTSLMKWQPDHEKAVYRVKFRNFLGNKALKYGDWGSDFHIRLFNRRYVHWNEADVHENLVLPPDVSVSLVKGYILHRTWRDIEEYKNKMKQYAQLGAEKYFKQGKKAGWLRLHVSPVFAFARSYFFKLGFLDGRAGYQCAAMMYYYTRLKYGKLESFNRKKQCS